VRAIEFIFDNKVMGGEAISFDGGKKVKGRKRTILVDTMDFGFMFCQLRAK
jgi:putative transposase